MDRYLEGKFGRSAISEFARKLHLDRIHGKLPHISEAREKQIIEKATKEFGPKAFKIRERDFEERVLNPLRIHSDDLFTPEEVDEVDKDFGFKEHTGRIVETDADDYKGDE